jgi:formylglycine-generating enzyme required for sulfatase activity
MAVLMAIGTEEPVPVRELNPGVPEPLARLVHQLLAKKPDQRPQTANEVAGRLRGILEQHLSPGAVVPAGPIPAVPSAEVSVSQPVVINPLPHQPPIVVPMQITAPPESVFAALDDDPTGPETPPAPGRASGGTGLLLAAGAVVLLAVATGAVVVATMNRGKKASDTSAVPAPTPAPATSGTGAKGAPSGPPPSGFRNSLGMEFVSVPKGTGWLGGRGGTPGDKPVEFKEDFHLGKYEVTQGEWEAVMGVNPSHFSRDGPGRDTVRNVPDVDLKRLPVETVSWDDARRFVERLNAREKETDHVYRLPTGAEWEYACRGGPIDRSDSGADFYFEGPKPVLIPGLANFALGPSAAQRTTKVGAYRPNALGLYDLHGNVWEWCEDEEQLPDGRRARVARGGSWSVAAGFCSATARFTAPPSYPFNSTTGLRLARVRSGPR